MFVTFEGVDGPARAPRRSCSPSGCAAEGRAVVATREPGGTPVGEAVRDLVLHGDEMTPWAEAALYAAARAEHVAQVIRPALERGADVVCDRYLDSSVAYQGIARGLGESTRARAEPDRHRRPAAGPDVPRRCSTPRRARARVGGDRDRIEREGGEFMRRGRRRLPGARGGRARSASSRSTATRQPDDDRGGDP